MLEGALFSCLRFELTSEVIRAGLIIIRGRAKLGGVPANTETSAVKDLRVRPRPRRQRCLFFSFKNQGHARHWRAPIRVNAAQKTSFEYPRFLSPYSAIKLRFSF